MYPYQEGIVSQKSTSSSSVDHQLLGDKEPTRPNKKRKIKGES